MVNKRFFAGILVMALVFGMALVGCSSDSAGDNSIVYTSKDSGGNTYKLEITKNTGKAAYTPSSGDNYKLTITYVNGTTKTSTGTVASYSSTTISLESKGGTFTVTINSGTMTKIDGTIPLDDNTNFTAPGTLTPQSTNPVSGPDPALNGTWVFSSYNGIWEYKFDKGNFVISLDGDPVIKGTYTTNNGNLTMTKTHIGGGKFWSPNSQFEKAKWYTKADLKAIGGFSDEELNEVFAPYTYTYSISGNKLTLGSGNDILTKK